MNLREQETVEAQQLREEWDRTTGFHLHSPLLAAAISAADDAQGSEGMGKSKEIAHGDKAEPTSLITAIVGDDHEAARSRIREILEEMGIKVIAEFSNGKLLLDAVLQMRPRLVTVDIRMPGLNGLVVTERIKQDCPETCVFVITNYPNEYYRRAAKKTGADAFIAKAEAYGELRKAVTHRFGPARKAAEDSGKTK